MREARRAGTQEASRIATAAKPTIAARSRSAHEERDVRHEVDLGDARRERQQPEARRHPADRGPRRATPADDARSRRGGRRAQRKTREKKPGSAPSAVSTPMSRFFSWTVMTSVATMLKVETRDDQADDEKERRLLDRERREEAAVHRAPVRHRVAVAGRRADRRAPRPPCRGSRRARTSTTLALPAHAGELPQLLAVAGRSTPSRTRRSSSGRCGRRGSGRSAATKRPASPEPSATESDDRVALAHVEPARELAPIATRRRARPAAPRVSARAGVREVRVEVARPGARRPGRCPSGPRPRRRASRPRPPRRSGRSRAPSRARAAPSRAAARAPPDRRRRPRISGKTTTSALAPISFSRISVR